MTDLPTDSLAFFDAEGVLFGHLRVAPSDRPDRVDCIFDFPETLASSCSEARWLAKRHYRQWSEHRFQQNEDGSLTISKANFKLHLDANEDGVGFGTRPPAPYVFADWV